MKWLFCFPSLYMLGLAEFRIVQHTLNDTRDGEIYRVRKLADGNCWMTENLRLKITEGQAIEISDGPMWTPTNYDGSTTNSTTLTANDAPNLNTLWKCSSNGGVCNAIVRSLDTTGFNRATGFYTNKNSAQASSDPEGVILNNNKFEVGTGYARFTSRRRRMGTVIRCVAQ